MHIIEQIGSYAGLAAVVGLAVLSVLYFSQARDVRRLREWAGRAPERAEAGQPVPASVAQRVVAQPQPKPGVPGQPAPTPGQPAPAPGQAAPAPGQPAPAGGNASPPPVPGAPAVGVPALASATGARPATATASGGPGPATPAGQGQQAPQAEPGTDAEKDEGEQDTGEAPDTSDTGEATVPGAPAPVTAGASEGRPAAATPAAQAAGAQTTAQPTPGTGNNRDSTEESDAVPPIAAATAAATKSPPAATAGAATPAAQARTPVTPPPPSASPRLPDRSAPPPRVSPGSATQIIPPPARPPGASTAPGRASLSGPRLAALIVAGVLVVGGGAAFGISQLTSDDDTSGSGSASSAGTGSGGGDEGKKAKSRPVDPSTVTVAVLNGTLVPGLAANIGDEVENSGFDLGTVANSSDQEQQRAESVVLYAKGHQREATAVGRRLKIPQREAIDPDTQALAGDASVVVIAGSDLTQ